MERAFLSTATGIRTPVSAVRGRRPSPLDDGGATAHLTTAGKTANYASKMERRPARLLVSAALCVAVLALLVTAAYTWGPAREADAAALFGFSGLYGTPAWSAADTLVKLADSGPFLLLSGGLLLAALIAGRRREATAAVILLAGAAATSQVLKPLLAFERPSDLLQHLTPPAAAFPSGHSTAAMSLALAAVLIAPARVRVGASVAGALFVITVSLSMLLVGGHFPSDIIGGYLVASAWGLAAFALLHRMDDPAPQPLGASRRPPGNRVVVGAAAVTLAIVTAVGTQEPGVDAFAREHSASVAVAIALSAAAAAALTAATATAARRG